MLKLKEEISAELTVQINQIVQKTKNQCKKIRNDVPLRKIQDNIELLLINERFCEQIRPYLCWIKQINIENFQVIIFKRAQKFSIFRQIGRITFGNLKILEIQNADTINIEAISWINCPNIKNLLIVQYFASNFQSKFSLKPLAKTNFRNLQMLSIYQNINKIDEQQFLCNRINLQSGQIQESLIQLTNNKDDVYQNLLPKMKSKANSTFEDLQHFNMEELRKLSVKMLKLEIFNLKFVKAFKQKFYCPQQKSVSNRSDADDEAFD